MKIEGWIAACVLWVWCGCASQGYRTPRAAPQLGKGPQQLPKSCPPRPQQGQSHYAIAMKIPLGRSVSHVRLNNSCSLVWSGDPVTQISSHPARAFSKASSFATSPEINDKGMVVWQGRVGFNQKGVENYEIFFNNQRLTRNMRHDNSPQINDRGEIIWLRDGAIYSNDKGKLVAKGASFVALNNRGEIAYRRGSGKRSTIVSTRRGILGRGDWPSINDHGEVVWMGLSKPPYKIYSSTRGLLATGNYPRLNNRGDVIYRRSVRQKGVLYSRAFVLGRDRVERAVFVGTYTHIHSFDINDRGMVAVSTYSRGKYAIYLLYPPKLWPLRR